MCCNGVVLVCRRVAQLHAVCGGGVFPPAAAAPPLPLLLHRSGRARHRGGGGQRSVGGGLLTLDSFSPSPAHDYESLVISELRFSL